MPSSLPDRVMLQLRAQLQLFNFPSQLIKDCDLIVHGGEGGGAEVHAVLTSALDRAKWSALRSRPPYPWGKTSLRPLEKEQGQHHDQSALVKTRNISATERSRTSFVSLLQSETNHSTPDLLWIQ